MTLRMPRLFDLRTDPVECADITSDTCYDWFLSTLCMIGAADVIVEVFVSMVPRALWPRRGRSGTCGRCRRGTARRVRALRRLP